MRLSYHKIHFLITVMILMLTACEKDKIEPAFNDAVLKGSTFYYETAYPYGGPFPLDKVTVKANGPYGSRTAVTNTNGEYEIKGLGNGTYEIEFLKKGWGATKYYSVQIYGNEIITKSQRIWKYPGFAMPVLDSKPEENQGGGMAFRSNLPESTTDVPYLRAFYSKSRDVSCFKYEYTDDGYYYSYSGHLIYNFSSYPDRNGARIFIVIYLCDSADNGEYDPYRAITVFPSINPEKHSQVIEYNKP